MILSETQEEQRRKNKRQTHKKEWGKGRKME